MASKAAGLLPSSCLVILAWQMDPAARLNIDEAIVNIGAEKIDELPDSTAAKERMLVSVIDTGVNGMKELRGEIVSYKNFTFKGHEV